MTEEIQLTPLEARQMEVDSYSANVANYQTLLKTLDGNWDSDLIHLKDVEVQEAARQCPMNRLERLAVLQQYDQVTNLLKTEIVERAKAQAILNILK
jgi:t-SNARE complex subunit (syntaxin)